MDRITTCGRKVVREAGVQVRCSDAGMAGLAGIASCGSVHACPVCSGKILVARTAEVEEAVARWLTMDEGHAVGLFTVTVRHGRRSRLGTLLDGMASAWSRMAESREFKALRARIGWRFQIKAFECRYGLEGWHPHYHVLVFLDRRLSADEVADAAGKLSAMWCSAVESSGLRRPARKGQDFRQFDGSAEVVAHDAGAYVTKAHYPRDVQATAARTALEVTRGDRKSSRTGVSVAPFDLLAAMVQHLRDSGGDRDSIEHLERPWVEWERATKGRRAHYWSRGLRKALGMSPGETDEAIAAEEVGTHEDALCEVTARDYRKMVLRSPVGAAALLDAVEAGHRLGGRVGAREACEAYLREHRVPFRPPMLPARGGRLGPPPRAA